MILCKNLFKYRAILLLLTAIMILRLGTLGLYPLMDTTEARYAEIARKMLELNDWVTPWFNNGVPFWGKPPLSFWVTAFSFKVFGVNEFAARLPHWLMGIAVAWLVWQMAVQRSVREAACAVAILLGSGLFFIASGGVMTDMALTLSTMIALRGFWLALYGNEKQKIRQRWLFFVGAGLGLLAKGPVALVLIGMPVFLWALATRHVVIVWRQLPWVRGILLTAAIAAPWYVSAELRTPGFLNYFLLGEHWHRFVTPGWAGDLYGSAHKYPRGTIWLFALVDWLPWSLLFPGAVLFLRKAAPTPAYCGETKKKNQQWSFYLLCWGLAPCLFFTFAGNILWAYVLPGMPAMALWGAGFLSRYSERDARKILTGGLVITGIGYLVLLSFLQLSGQVERKSAKSLIRAYQEQKQLNEPLFIFSSTRLYSAAFYSHGKAEQIVSKELFLKRLKTESAFIAIEKSFQKEFENNFYSNYQLQPVGNFGNFILFAPLQTKNSSLQ